MSATILIRKEQLAQRGVSLSHLLDETIAVSYPKIYKQLEQHGFIERPNSRRIDNLFRESR